MSTQQYTVYIKIVGLQEQKFSTSAESDAKAMSNAHAQYATKLNMSIPQYMRQIRISGYTARAVRGDGV